MIFVSRAILLLCIALVLAFLMQFSGSRVTENAFANLTPWQCVGGCGAGGSGGSAADVKWIGQGQTGGLIDAEVMGSLTLGQNYEYKQVKTRLSMKPTWTTNLGLTIPIVSKQVSCNRKPIMTTKPKQAAGWPISWLMFRKISAWKANMRCPST